VVPSYGRDRSCERTLTEDDCGRVTAVVAVNVKGSDPVAATAPGAPDEQLHIVGDGAPAAESGFAAGL
jgi:hypothetical protein